MSPSLYQLKNQLTIYTFITLIIISVLSVTSVAGATQTRLMQQDFEDPRVPWEPRPVLGAQRTLVILVEFTDVRFLTPISYIRQLTDTVDQFFKLSSYGQMWLDYDILENVITLPNPMSSYGVPEPGSMRGDSLNALLQYYQDIFSILQLTYNIDLAEYNHIVIIHAGGDEAATGNPYEIWSHCFCLGPVAEEMGADNPLASLTGTTKTWGVSTFSESESWSVFVHEFTHSLGITDLYVYGEDGYSSRSEIGYWTNMDAGAFLDPPVDIDGWNKYILGWIKPIIHEKGTKEYTINSLDSGENPMAVIVPVNDIEYYFIHARRKAGQDKAVPSEGVLIFKINKMHSRSFENSLLATLQDANPTTPDCTFTDRRNLRICEGLDAPINSRGKQYTATTHWGEIYFLTLEGEEFISKVDNVKIQLVESNDKSYRIKIISGSVGSEEDSGEEKEKPVTITVTSTVYETVTNERTTTITTIGTVTKTVVITYTVKEVVTRPLIDYTPLLLVLIGFFLGILIMAYRGRRVVRLPPPPPSVG